MKEKLNFFLNTMKKYSLTFHLASAAIMVIAALMTDDAKTRDFLIFGVSLCYLALVMYALLDCLGNPQVPLDEVIIIGDNFRRRGIVPTAFMAAVKELRQMNVGSALETFKELAETDESKITPSEKAVLSYYTGRCYQMMGYTTNAVNCYQQSIDDGFDEPSAYIFAGRCCTAAGDFDRGEKYYDTLLEKRESDPKYAANIDYIYTDKGMLYIKKGDGKTAMEMFSLSIEKRMNYAFALGGCAIALLLLGDTESSKDYYARAVANNVDDLTGFKEYYKEVAQSENITVTGIADEKKDKEENDVSGTVS